MFLKVRARAESGGAVRAGKRAFATVNSGVLCESSGHTEALPTDPAHEGTLAAVDPLVILKVGKLPETLSTDGTLPKKRNKQKY